LRSRVIEEQERRKEEEGKKPKKGKPHTRHALFSAETFRSGSDNTRLKLGVYFISLSATLGLETLSILASLLQNSQKKSFRVHNSASTLETGDQLSMTHLASLDHVVDFEDGTDQLGRQKVLLPLGEQRVKDVLLFHI
jgi:ATP-dependent DNA ligase